MNARSRGCLQRDTRDRNSLLMCVDATSGGHIQGRSPPSGFIMQASHQDSIAINVSVLLQWLLVSSTLILSSSGIQSTTASVVPWRITCPYSLVQTGWQATAVVSWRPVSVQTLLFSPLGNQPRELVGINHVAVSSRFSPRVRSVIPLQTVPLPTAFRHPFVQEPRQTHASGSVQTRRVDTAPPSWWQTCQVRSRAIILDLSVKVRCLTTLGHVRPLSDFVCLSLSPCILCGHQHNWDTERPNRWLATHRAREKQFMRWEMSWENNSDCLKKCLWWLCPPRQSMSVTSVEMTVPVQVAGTQVVGNVPESIRPRHSNGNLTFRN